MEEYKLNAKYEVKNPVGQILTGDKFRFIQISVSGATPVIEAAKIAKAKELMRARLDQHFGKGYGERCEIRILPGSVHCNQLMHPGKTKKAIARRKREREKNHTNQQNLF